MLAVVEAAPSGWFRHGPWARNVAAGVFEADDADATLPGRSGR